jgi:dipeptidase
MLDVYEWDTGKFLGRIRQARQTYNVIGNMNEHQVIIGETTFGGREELHNPKGIVDYGSLIYIALQRATSAREAIRIMTDLVNEYGYYSEGESFSIVDAKEAWILEMLGRGEGVKGTVWAAVRIPDGHVSGHANHARITTFPLNDPENAMYAPDVIQFAKNRGWFSGKESEFSFSDAFAPLNFGAIRFCDARVWSLYRRVNKGMEKYSAYIKPDRKLNVQDVMQLMRDHYEGTELDMTKGIAAGPYNMPYRWRPLEWEVDSVKYFNERPISTPQTGFSFVGQARSWLPNEIGGLLWFGLDDTYMTVYVPMYASITGIPHNFGKGIASLCNFSWESAFWVFNFVSNYAYPRYSLLVNDITTVQHELEGMFLSRQETVEKTALSYYKESKGKAVDYLTNYSKEMGDLTIQRWTRLGQTLVQKYMDGVVKDEFCRPKNVGYPESFRREIVEDQGDFIRVKTIAADPAVAYREYIAEADKLIEEKKFTESKKLYEKALSVKPGEAYPTERIAKLTRIIAEIENFQKDLKPQ